MLNGTVNQMNGPPNFSNSCNRPNGQEQREQVDEPEIHRGEPAWKGEVLQALARPLLRHHSGLFSCLESSALRS